MGESFSGSSKGDEASKAVDGELASEGETGRSAFAVFLFFINRKAEKPAKAPAITARVNFLFMVGILSGDACYNEIRTKTIDRCGVCLHNVLLSETIENIIA